jgi:hypothetical protein
MGRKVKYKSSFGEIGWKRAKWKVKKNGGKLQGKP